MSSAFLVRCLARDGDHSRRTGRLLIPLLITELVSLSRHPDQKHRENDDSSNMLRLD